MFRNFCRRSVEWTLTAAALALLAPSLASAFELVSDLPSPQPLGTTITWSVTGAPPHEGDLLDFRLNVRRVAAGETSHVVYDYSRLRTLEWTPMAESAYTVTGLVRNQTTGETTQINQNFVVLPRVGSDPRVFNTRSPLVALYSAPTCTAGNTMEVTFRTGDEAIQRTPRKACDSTQTMNFLIAGMRPETGYVMRHVIRNAQGDTVGLGPVRFFATGAAEAGLPTITVATPPGPTASTDDDILIAGPTAGIGGTLIATDLNGTPVWYYTSPDQGEMQFVRIVPGGDMLFQGPSSPADRYVLREVDLASNIVRQTNTRRINERMRALGQPSITVMHHEARRLPNGHTIVLADSERITDIQGPGLDVLADVIIDLDEDFQPVWATNLWDLLDRTRLAVLGETCTDNGPGCPPLYLADLANDWTHSNAVGYSPTDGNLIVSSRHQDYIMKIDYRNGLGTGGLIWRLGRDGDFTLSTEANDGWFSHQHDTQYLGGNRVIMFDNGNANPDCLADPLLCRSFGKVYQLNEDTMVATPVLNANLQNFSFAIGASERLTNGNYHFNSGIYGGTSFARAQEVDPAGHIVFELQISLRTYRSYRLQDMYTPPQY